MIYRLHFDPKGAHWCIQFQRWFMFWVPVRSHEDNGILALESTKGKLEVLKFKNLMGAEEYCASVGIDKAYHRMSTTSYMTAVLSGAKSDQEEDTPKTKSEGGRLDGWLPSRMVLMKKNTERPSGPQNETFPTSLGRSA